MFLRSVRGDTQRFLGAGSAVHPQQAASPPGHQAGEHVHLSGVPHPLPAQEVSFFTFLC